MSKIKMLQARVDEKFHSDVMSYADANNRSVQQLIRHALKFYMNAHPMEWAGERGWESMSEEDTDCEVEI